MECSKKKKKKKKEKVPDAGIEVEEAMEMEGARIGEARAT